MPMNKELIRLRYDMRMAAGSEDAEILLYGEISSFKWFEEDDDVMTARDFDKLVKQAKADGAKRVTLRINSPGGTVNQAVAMRTMLMNAGFDKIDVSIEGMCASAATLFVCLPDAHIRIAQGSEFMIHNPRMSLYYATAADMEHEAERLHKQEEQFHAMYAARCGKSADDVKAWMDAETWFTADEAVEAGFADEVISGNEMAACVSPKMMAYMRDTYRNTPETVQETAEETVSTAGGETASENDTRKDEPNMELNELNMEALEQGNAALYQQILQQGAQRERERAELIDSMTPPGYEQLAAQAKADGADGQTYAQMLAKAIREKGADYMRERKAETEPANHVLGDDPKAHDKPNAEQEMQEFVSYMSTLAKDMKSKGHFANMGNMY